MRPLCFPSKKYVVHIIQTRTLPGHELRRLERAARKEAERQRKEAERQRRAASKGAGKSATGQLKLQWPLIQTSKKKSQEGGEPK